SNRMNILVLGAGRMGYGAAFDLVHNSPGVEHVTVADFDLSRAEYVVSQVGTSKIAARKADAAVYEDIVELFRDHDSVISCVNYWYNVSLSKAAIESGANFCDLGGNNYVVDEIDEIHIRVGGLPQDPQPPLNYQLVFSVEGLINEYVETARVIRQGKIVTVQSMTETEALEFDGFPPLEAFQTSGGTSTLPDTFLGKIRELDYKTIRYTGHCEKFKTMIDHGLCSSDEIVVDFQKVKPRKLFGELLQRHL